MQVWQAHSAVGMDAVSLCSNTCGVRSNLHGTLMQATWHYYSGNRFLVLHLCSLVVANVLTATLHFMFSLLSCGDTEANPGPTEQKLLMQLLMKIT